jgi:Mg2+-importing ATPase
LGNYPPLIVLIIRTRKPFLRSKPGKYLLMTTLMIVVVTCLLPITPLAEPLGLKPLPLKIFVAIGIILAFYIAAAEITKRFFYKRVNL